MKQKFCNCGSHNFVIFAGSHFMKVTCSECNQRLAIIDKNKAKITFDEQKKIDYIAMARHIIRENRIKKELEL